MISIKDAPEKADFFSKTPTTEMAKTPSFKKAQEWIIKHGRRNQK